MAFVTLEGIIKIYENAKEAAVKDVSFQVEDGEFMVLLGPSGCGKSTVLRMIAGLETISGGELRIDGELMNNVPAKDRDIAMVFQSYALYPHMKVRDNLAFGLRRRGIIKDEINGRVEQVAESLGLTPYLDRKPHALSGGQRQRVAVGRAIVRDPKVFLFDEPLSNLDASLRVSTRNELVNLHNRLGATTIYVTHDQVEAMTMGTRICIINDGQLIQIGPPMEVYRKPANMFVAGFLGSPPMNLIEADLVSGDNGRKQLNISSQVIDLPDEWQTCLQDGPDKLVFGIRPEDIFIPSPDKKSNSYATLNMEVAAVEALGAETVLIFCIEGIDTKVFVKADRFIKTSVGARIGLQIDMSAARLFDPATTQVITNGTE
jgi:multiple sugar transport system ATP-binding protein